MQSIKQTYLAKAEEAVTPGANLGFGNNTANLNTVIETLVADGKQALIKAIIISIRAKVSVADNVFALLPVIVQTAGTFADTANLTDREISAILDQCIDDEFGVLKMGNFRVSKSGPTGTLADRQIIETRYIVPPAILKLLSKESSSERLQDIYIGFVGLSDANNDIEVDSYYEIEFVERTKGITIR